MKCRVYGCENLTRNGMWLCDICYMRLRGRWGWTYLSDRVDYDQIKREPLEERREGGSEVWSYSRFEPKEGVWLRFIASY